MAFYLTEKDVLFVTPAKCGTFFLEEVLKAFKIPYTQPDTVDSYACPRHSSTKYYEPVSKAFCLTRDIDNFMRSYWRFHVMANPDNQVFKKTNFFYRHEVLGPPLPSWQEFKETKRQDCIDYLEEMKEGCETINLGNIYEELSKALCSLGYDVPVTKLRQIPVVHNTILHVELGGGFRNLGAPWVNVDLTSNAQLNHDLNVFPYPFGDDFIDSLYTSHCMEHLSNVNQTFQEIVRICRVGAKVVIKVPHPFSEMAMCEGHTNVISPMQILNADLHFADDFWKGPKRLKLAKQTFNASARLQEAKAELPFLQTIPDDIIMKWIPGTCHESVFEFDIIKNTPPVSQRGLE